MTNFAEPAEYADLRAAIREITLTHGPAEYAEHGRTGTPMTGLWQDLGKAGFIGINVPAEFGGGGAGMAELAMVTEESAAAGCPLLLLLVSSAIGVEVLRRHGSPAQQEEWLTRLADGSSKVVFAITEPDAGSNSHHITTTARRDGDDYVIAGQKYYISGVEEADAVITVTRTGTDPVTGKAELSLFLVPMNAPGVSWNRLEVAAQIPDRQYTVFFDDVRVPATALIGEEGKGWLPLFDGLNPERITAAALGVGIGRYAVDAAAAYARTRNVWDVPIGSHQGVSHPLAKAKIHVELAALMTAKAAWLHDNGLPAGEASNMAKYAAAEAAIEAVDAAIQVHGGNGLSVEYGLLPMWGMARLLRIAPVNSEMVLNYVAQHTLKLPRSY
jgi:hypothetical protein